MRKKITGLLVLACLALSGCVMKSTYQQKELEAQGLAKSLQEERSDYRKLRTENEQLQSQVDRLTRELKAMTGERDTLATDKRGLEESLRSTSDAKNRKIGDLSKTVDDLKAENLRLKDEVAQLQQQKSEVQKTSKTYEELVQKMKGEISKGEVTISELKGRLTVNLVEAVLFDSGKAEVKPNGRLVLQKVVDILKNVKDKAIRIEGHTDNVPIVGALTRRYPSNWELSAARAINVAKYLQQQGIDPALLSADAYGPYRPVASNDSAEGRAKNRRIEIVLVSKEEGPGAP